MKTEDEIKEEIIEALRSGIHFSPQLDGYVVHGAVAKIYDIIRRESYPYQICPKCNGEKFISNYGYYGTQSRCNICGGAGIITKPNFLIKKDE